jgi:DNA repair/transcription protein MET18/MMS19
LIERLKDVHSVASVAAALHTAVTKRPQFSGLEIETASALFENVAVQTMGQQPRQHVLGLMLALVRRYPATLRAHFGERFVAEVVQQVDQEKDPRCLMAAFALVAAVAREFPLGEHADAIFDVVACYFPITFTPPPNDKVGITKDDLIASLRKCFVASPSFAKPFLSLVFESVSAPGDETKVQCYETLAACVGAYSPADLSNFVSHM